MEFEGKTVIGCDEVGYGSLVNSVVVGAVVWEPYYFIEGLNDSKKLTAIQREHIFQRCVDANICFATGSADVNEIEKFNIYHATRIAMKRAIDSILVINIQKYPEIVLVDGKGYIEGLPIKQKWIIKGDTKEPAIMAASVIAKVLRDRYIRNLVIQFPEYKVYGWNTNVGYRSKKHLEAIKKHGITSFHRKTFEPIKTWLKEGIIK